MKKLAVIIVALISFLSFSSFSFAQGVMTNTEMTSPKGADEPKPAKKVRKAGGAKHTKGNHGKSKKIKHPKKKTEEHAQSEKINP